MLEIHRRRWIQIDDTFASNGLICFKSDSINKDQINNISKLLLLGLPDLSEFFDTVSQGAWQRCQDRSLDRFAKYGVSECEDADLHQCRRWERLSFLLWLLSLLLWLLWLLLCLVVFFEESEDSGHMFLDCWILRPWETQESVDQIFSNHHLSIRRFNKERIIVC